MSSDPNFFFSPKQPAPEARSVSIFVDNSIFGYFKELVKHYGEFEFKSTQDGFHIRVGEFEFSVSELTDSFCISMLNISSLNPRAAELLAKLTYILFYDKYGSCKLRSMAFGDEEKVWVAGTEEGIYFKADNPEQANRFKQYAEKRAAQFRENHKSPFHFDPKSGQLIFPENDPKP